MAAVDDDFIALIPTISGFDFFSENKKITHLIIKIQWNKK